MSYQGAERRSTHDCIQVKDIEELKNDMKSNRNLKSWLAANVCESWLSRVWRRLTALAIVVSISGCSGCLQIPDWTVTDASAVEYSPSQEGGIVSTNAIERAE